MATAINWRRRAVCLAPKVREPDQRRATRSCPSIKLASKLGRQGRMTLDQTLKMPSLQKLERLYDRN